ncbi:MULTISPECIES: hypothetical protein [Giesbergeria]|uniref:Uncharacterized protein n=1 Tax=Giesbergeria sinuosa TaxID=80883 RepID=A0ABV9QCI2_9BURK
MANEYNRRVIDYCIEWADGVQEDLDAVYVENEDNGLFLDELFDLLVENAKVREALTWSRFQHINDPRFDAAPVEWSKQWGYNLYYLKMWRQDGVLLPVRLIYAVHHVAPNPSIWIMGLMHRSDDYDEHSEFAQRVRSDYDRYGIARIPC